MSWKGGVIEVGRGAEVGQSRLMHWRDDEGHKEVSAVSLATGGGQRGRWLIPRHAGESMFPTESFDLYSTQFVQSCNGLHGRVVKGVGHLGQVLKLWSAGGREFDHRLWHDRDEILD